MEQHFYYLHINGDLIHKRFRPDPSDFVQRNAKGRDCIWELDLESRSQAWLICIEALACGAKKSRIDELAEKWGLTDDDAQVFSDRNGLTLFKDGNQWCAGHSDFINLQESEVGFGDTALEAFAELAKHGLAIA